jgi:hypothetical protein
MAALLIRFPFAVPCGHYCRAIQDKSHSRQNYPLMGSGPPPISYCPIEKYPIGNAPLSKKLSHEFGQTEIEQFSNCYSFRSFSVPLQPNGGKEHLSTFRCRNAVGLAVRLYFVLQFTGHISHLASVGWFIIRR